MEPGGGGRGRGGKGARRGKSGGGARGRRGSARGEAVGAVAEGAAGAWWANGGGAGGGYVGAGGLAAGETGWGVGEGVGVGSSARGGAVTAWEGGGTGGGVGAVGGGGEAANAAEGWTTGGGAEGWTGGGAEGWTGRGAEGRVSRRRGGRGRGADGGAGGRSVRAREGAGRGRMAGGTGQTDGSRGRGVEAHGGRGAGVARGQGWMGAGAHARGDARMRGGTAGRGWDAGGGMGYLDGRVSGGEALGAVRGQQGRVEGAWRGRRVEMAWEGDGEEEGERWDVGGEEAHARQHMFRGAAGGWVEGGQDEWQPGAGVGGGGEELGRNHVVVRGEGGEDGAWGEWYEGEGGGATEEEWEGEGGEEWGGEGGEEWGGVGWEEWGGEAGEGEGEEDFELGYAAGLAAAREALRQASATTAVAAGAGVGPASTGGVDEGAPGGAAGGMDLMLPHHPPAAAGAAATSAPAAPAAEAEAGQGAGEQEGAGGGDSNRRRGGGGGGAGGGSRGGRRKHVDVSVKRDICELKRVRPGITVGGIMRVCRAKYPHMRFIPSHVRRILDKADHWSSTLAQRSSKRVRAPESMALEEALVAWLREKKGGPGATKVQLQEICAKGRELGPSYGVSPSFRYSIGWACRFQERWGFSKRHLEEEREAYFNEVDDPAAATAAAGSAEPSLLALADEIFGTQILVARTHGDGAAGEQGDEGDEGDEEGSEEGDEGGEGGRRGRGGRGGRRGRGVVGRAGGREGGRGGMRVVGRATSLTAGMEVIDLEGGEGGEGRQRGEGGEGGESGEEGMGGERQGRRRGQGEEGEGGGTSGAEAAEAGGWQGEVDLLAGTARGAARERARKKAAGRAARPVQPSRELLALALAEAGVDGEQAGAGVQAARGSDSDTAAGTEADEGVRRAAPPAGAAVSGAAAAAAAAAAATAARVVDVEAAVAAAGDLRLDPPSDDSRGGHGHAERQSAADREKRAAGKKGKHRAAISLRVKRVICMLRAARPHMAPKDIHRLVHRAFYAAARHAHPPSSSTTGATAAAAGSAASLAAGGVAAAAVEAAGMAALDVAAVRRILRKSAVYLALPAHCATRIRHSSGAHPHVQAAVAAWVRAMEARYGREAVRWDDILDYAREVGRQMGVEEGFRYSYHWARKALLRHGLGSDWGKQGGAVLLREDEWRQLVKLSPPGRPGAVRLRGAEARLEEALALAVRRAIARMEQDRQAEGGFRGDEGGGRGGVGAGQQQVSVRAVQEYAKRLAPLVGEEVAALVALAKAQRERRAQIKASGRRLTDVREEEWVEAGRRDGGGGQRRAAGDAMESDGGDGDGGVTGDSDGGFDGTDTDGGGAFDTDTDLDLPAFHANTSTHAAATAHAFTRSAPPAINAPSSAPGAAIAAADAAPQHAAPARAPVTPPPQVSTLLASLAGVRVASAAHAAPHLHAAWAALAAATPFPRRLTAHRAAEVARAWQRLERARVVVWEGGAGSEGSESSESMSVEEIGGLGSSMEEWQSKEAIAGAVAGRSAGGGKAGGRGRKRRRSGDAQDGVVTARGGAAAGSGAGMAGRGAAGAGQQQVSAGMAAPVLSPELLVAAALRAALAPHPMPAPPAAHFPRFPFPHTAPPTTTALHSLAQLLASAGLPPLTNYAYDSNFLKHQARVNSMYLLIVGYTEVLTKE
ncbi:unnamed protein product [Closterium sp. Yama58-4]|nr:unnamed protein product [Closterium sp. Yama58-4]